jgi:hypothetical protein
MSPKSFISNLLESPCGVSKKVARPGFEPGQTEPKSRRASSLTSDNVRFLAELTIPGPQEFAIVRLIGHR